MTLSTVRPQSRGGCAGTGASTLTAMSWSERFGELEGAAESLEREERDIEIADRTRAHLSTVSWLDRCAGCETTLRVAGVGVVRGLVDTVAGPWLLVHADAATDWVLAISAVTGVSQISGHPVPRRQRGRVAAAMTWVNAWTVLARDRGRVQVVRADGSRVTGVPGSVGHDFVEVVAESGRGELVPYAAITAVRCQR